LPDSRFASSAAVFSMILTTSRLKCGFSPVQCGFCASTMRLPGTSSTMRYGPKASPGLVGSVSYAVLLRYSAGLASKIGFSMWAGTIWKSKLS